MNIFIILLYALSLQMMLPLTTHSRSFTPPPPLTAIFGKLVSLLEKDVCFAESSNGLAQLCSIGTEYAFAEKALKMASCSCKLNQIEEICCVHSLKDCLQALSGKQWRVYTAYLLDLKSICHYYEEIEGDPLSTIDKVQELINSFDLVTYSFYAILCFIAVLERAPWDCFCIIIIFFLTEFGFVLMKFDLGQQSSEIRLIWKIAMIAIGYAVIKRKRQNTKTQDAQLEPTEAQVQPQTQNHSQTAGQPRSEPHIEPQPPVQAQSHVLRDEGKKTLSKINTTYSKETPVRPCKPRENISTE